MWDDEPEAQAPDAVEPGPHPRPRLRRSGVLIVLTAFVISVCLCCLAARSATGLFDLDPDQLWWG